jgi:hypothetical protein
VAALSRRTRALASLVLAVVLLIVWHGRASLGPPSFLLPCVDAAVSSGQRQGLVNLYLATRGSGWKGPLTGWPNHTDASVDPCNPEWTGVTCTGGEFITYVGPGGF